MGVNVDIEAALEAAATGVETVTSPETVVDASEETKAEAEKAPKGGANERIRELVGNTKELKTQLDDVSSTLKERDSEIARLVELLEFKEKDSRVVAKINELYETNTELKPVLDILDRAVRGEQVDLSQLGISKKEVAANPEGVKDTLLQAKELVNSTKQELEAQIAEQRHELILSRADLLADNYLGQLPKEYGEEDVRIVREVLVDKIDWDAIDANPEALTNEFKKGFEKTLKWYGTPKGAAQVSNKSNEKVKEDITPEKLRAFSQQEWGRTRIVEDAKGKREELEVSDADFAKALGAALKNSRRF